jgi:hypothetical protein
MSASAIATFRLLVTEQVTLIGSSAHAEEFTSYEGYSFCLEELLCFYIGSTAREFTYGFKEIICWHPS